MSDTPIGTVISSTDDGYAWVTLNSTVLLQPPCSGCDKLGKELQLLSVRMAALEIMLMREE